MCVACGRHLVYDQLGQRKDAWLISRREYVGPKKYCTRDSGSDSGIVKKVLTRQLEERVLLGISRETVGGRKRVSQRKNDWLMSKREEFPRSIVQEIPAFRVRYREGDRRVNSSRSKWGDRRVWSFERGEHWRVVDASKLEFKNCLDKGLRDDWKSRRLTEKEQKISQN